MAKNIIEFNIDGTSYTQRPYCTCSTAADTVAKVVTCADFNLVAGATVMVQFTNANTVDNPTLNVNNTGAKPIFYRGTRLSSFTFNWNWDAYDIIEFRYNGSRWDILNISNAKTATSLYKSEVITSSSSTNKDKWIKFATVDVSASGYNRCSGHLIFSDNENGNFFGILGLYITTTATISDESVSLRWISLDNILFKDSVAVVKVNDGIFDLYFKAVAHWLSPQVYYHGAHPEKITFNCGDASTYVDNITPLKVSSLDSQASNSDNATKLGGKSINAFMTYEDSTNYVNANFNDTTLDAKAASTYIEYWSSNGGWYNSKWGTVTAVNGFVGNIQGTLSNDTAYHTDPIVLKNIKFDNPGGYERSIVGSKVNNNRDFNLGIYGNYTSESTKSTYAWMGYNAYDGDNLRIYSDGKLQWGDYPIIHSNNIGSYKAGSTVGTLTVSQPKKTDTFNGSANVTITVNRDTLGLDKVMDYIGKTSTPLSDGSTTNPITIDSKSITAVSGNVVIDKDSGREYIWNGSAWELFGADDVASSYKPKQSIVNDPTASGTSTTFIDTISQDENGKITVTKKNIPTSLKNPNKLTLKVGNNTPIEYDGSSAKTVNITPSSIGALALTGGTLTGPLTISNNSLNITNEKPVVFNIPRCNENGGGWAVKQLIVNGHEDSKGNYPTVYSMGSYGQNNALNYIFIGANEYSSTENLRIYPNGNVEAPTFTGNLIGYVTGNVTGNVNGNVNGNASTATKSGSGGGIWLCPENGNEVNFGGTSADSTVYFGYRAKDSKPIPTLFIFGSSTGTSQIKAAGFIKKDSSNSYVLLGGGGHKAISDFATASKLGSSTIGAADRPIYLSGGSPVQTTYRMAGTNEVATTGIDISSATNTGIWYVNGTSNIYSQTDGVAIVNKYNDSWISQIYQDYRTGKLAVRGKNNGVWTEWKKIALTSDIPTSLPWSSITSKPTFATVATTGSYNDLTNKPTIPAAVTVDTSLSSTSTNPVQNKVINDALGNKADKSETILGYNLQERIEDLDLGTKNRFFRTGGSPSNAPGQNGYVVGLTMALNNDSEYRVQLAYDQSINRLSYRQQIGDKGWMNWKTMALLTDIPTIPTIGNGTITIKQNGTSKGTFTVNQTGNTTIELTDTTGITSQDHYKTSVTAGTAGTSSATSGSTLAVPYVTVNANGHVTGYGTHTHTISGFLTSHQPIYNLTMQAGAFSAATFDPNGAAKTVNIPTKTSHLTNDSGFLTSETYKGTVTKVSTGVGLTGGDITSTGTIKCKLNSETSLGTIGTTSKLYAVGVDANGKLCVNVPWTDTNTDTSTTYAGHYTPSGTAKTGTASGNTLSYGGAVVTGLTYDGKGHVTGFATSKLPSAITVDTSLSSTSTNPVQNKVINSALNNKMDKVTLATVATTGSYNDLTNKPTIPTIPSSLPSNGIINAYTTNGITSPAISVSGAIRFDTMVCTQYLGNTNKFTGCNNAILSISRFENNQYTTQLGFSGNGIYARIFNGKTPDTSTSWKTMIMDDGAGNVTAKAFYISSDERLKTFGDDIKVDFDELAKLRKSHFVFNDNPTKQEIGVSAQEVQKIYPEIVNETEEGTLSVDYSKLAVVALAAIDKLNQRVQELENKLAKYE